MSKKGENIYKRKDGRWEGRYIRLRNIGGKAEYGYIYGKSYAEVKKKLMNAKSSRAIACRNARKITRYIWSIVG